jgi:hypothetical protein
MEIRDIDAFKEAYFDLHKAAEKECEDVLKEDEGGEFYESVKGLNKRKYTKEESSPEHPVYKESADKKKKKGKKKEDTSDVYADGEEGEFTKTLRKDDNEKYTWIEPSPEGDTVTKEAFQVAYKEAANLPTLTKAFGSTVGKRGLLAGGAAYGATSDIDNPYARAAITAMATGLGSKGRARAGAKKSTIKRLYGSEGLKTAPDDVLSNITKTPEFKSSELTRSGLGLLQGAGLGAGAHMVNRLGSLGDSISTGKGQELLTKMMGIADTAGDTIKDVGAAAGTIADTGKDAAKNVKDITSHVKHFGQSLGEEAKPVIEFINKHKGKFAVGSAALLLALIYSRFKKGREADANADFVHSMLNRARNSRRGY